LDALPPDTGLAVVFIQHLAPGRVSMLAEILSRATSMPVTEVKDEPLMEANHVYVVPPGQLMIVSAGALHLAEAQGMQHRGIDRFFASLAEDQGHRAIGVVLSGTATDGTLGLEAIKAAGGITFAQDASAQHEGMPRSANSSGCVDFVLSPAQIAMEIAALSAHLGAPSYDRSEALPLADEFEHVLEVLRQESGVDFSQYKSSTLHRRIRRRMALRRVPSLPEYGSYLKANAKEIEALYQDILIGVTSFFRDPEAFEALKEKVFPALFADRSRHDPIRVWVLGCATGEESYSLAIALKEYATAINSQAPLTVYATDLNNVAVEKSRAGLYPRTISLDVSRERLKRFFVEADGGYRIAKSIRDMCVFARHNMLTDPPFSRMDLISCRNVLIYIEPVLQKKLLSVLHYSLKPKGYLFLGPSESLGGQRDVFDVEDSKHKIFRKKSAPSRTDLVIPPLPPGPRGGHRKEERWTDALGEVRPELQRDAERVLVSRYVPPGVLVTHELEIVQFRGETGHVLAPAPGKASLNVLKMAREGLLIPLRAALQSAIKDNGVVRRDGVRVASTGGHFDINLTIVPVQTGNAHACYWVLFEPTDPAAESRTKRSSRSARAKRVAPAEIREYEEQVSRLTQELSATREYLQSVIEQQEAANEELQSANEEVQSANEELQSINEELETSKEEIQSSNEELTTVNEELQNRNEELNRVNNDLNNLFGSVQMPIVMVWRDLRIRRFTPLAEKLFNLIASDVGRPISDIKLKVEVEDLPAILTEVIESMSVREREVQDSAGHWFQLRVRPYETLEGQIDGAVIMLVDIDALKRNQEAIARQAELLEHTTDAIFVHDPEGVVQYWNRGAERLYGVSRTEACGKRVQQFMSMDRDKTAAARAALARGEQWQGEVTVHKADGAVVIVATNQVSFIETGRALILETHHDVTEHKQLEQALQQRVQELALADKSKNDFLAMLAHELRNPLAPLRNAVQILKKAPQNVELAERTRELIDRQVTNMVRMVDDLLDAARLGRGRIDLHMEALDLQAVLHRAVEATRPAFEMQRHRLSVLAPPVPVLVRGDATRLEQVFANLLSNAAKYTDPGGEITVTLVVNAQESQRAEAVIRVRDNGVGISAEMLPRVFDLFTQADHSLARTQGGLGIGLNIVRRIVELHQGQVSAHSAGPGLGSEFVVHLPVQGEAHVDGEKAKSTAALPTRGEGAESSAHGGTRVLIVDDSPDITASTATLLGLHGYSVKTASDGEHALAIAHEFAPDVVLLDLGMPGLDGFAVARTMRASEHLREVMLVAVSGYGAEEDRAKTKAAGFDHHFMKPLDVEDFQSTIMDHWERMRPSTVRSVALDGFEESGDGKTRGDSTGLASGRAPSSCK
jgi:two-component system CheB/CheR fusion protein